MGRGLQLHPGWPNGLAHARLGTKPLMSTSLTTVMHDLGFRDSWRDLHPEGHEFTCYSFMHNTFSRLDCILTSGIDLQSLVEVKHFGRFLSEYAPELLALQWGPPRQHVHGWCMPPDLLVDPACQEAIAGALVDYLECNLHSATTKELGWEALKAVIHGACMGVTYGVQRQLEATLGAQDRRLAVLQGSGDIAGGATGGTTGAAQSAVGMGLIGQVHTLGASPGTP
ncbi:hypothetical protein NDU88_005092 [Pleurodeles waltl]|uniref:Uncharacterized protein n=1 Tax=Pleurodeles waltl TaxID=8319 RepID=A0AAV7NP82_PLEWA|nr:hypothetical protein NDU88_005092 [Pleurodeles waltl]